MHAFVESEGESARRAVLSYRKQYGKYPAKITDTKYANSKKVHWWVNGNDDDSGEVFLRYKLNWDEGLIGVLESQFREPGWYFYTESGGPVFSDFADLPGEPDGNDDA